MRAFEFKLPDLGEGIHEGEVLKWHVAPGDEIREDDPLVEIETDKAAVTIPCPVGGLVVSITGEVGGIVHTGAILCVIQVSGEPRKAAPKTAETEAIARYSVEAGVGAPPSSPPRSRAPAAPATRRLARELGVDIQRVPGSGPAGRVLDADVRASVAGPAEPPPVPAAAAPPAAAPVLGIPFLQVEPLPEFVGPVERVPLRSIRRKVARKMVTSMILAPHVAHMDEADVTELEALRLGRRAGIEGRHGVRISLLSFVMRAIARGLRETPEFNASLDHVAQQIVLKRYVNLGFAADTERGLVVPVLHGAEHMSVLELARETATLASQARDGDIAAHQLRGGTFTITNIGPLGGTAVVPTINYPEVAILGMAMVQEKPVVHEGEIAIRKILPLTLSFDHRVADGAQAARFVTRLIQRLEDPATLLIET